MFLSSSQKFFLHSHSTMAVVQETTVGINDEVFTVVFSPDTPPKDEPFTVSLSSDSVDYKATISPKDTAKITSDKRKHFAFFKILQNALNRTDNSVRLACRFTTFDSLTGIITHSVCCHLHTIYPNATDNMLFRFRSR